MADFIEHLSVAFNQHWELLSAAQFAKYENVQDYEKNVYSDVSDIAEVKYYRASNPEEKDMVELVNGMYQNAPKEELI